MRSWHHDADSLNDLTAPQIKAHNELRQICKSTKPGDTLMKYYRRGKEVWLEEKDNSSDEEDERQQSGSEFRLVRSPTSVTTKMMRTRKRRRTGPRKGTIKLTTRMTTRTRVRGRPSLALLPVVAPSCMVSGRRCGTCLLWASLLVALWTRRVMSSRERWVWRAGSWEAF